MQQQRKENDAIKTEEERKKADLERSEKGAQSSGNSSTDIIANIRQNGGNNDAAREMVPHNDGH